MEIMKKKLKISIKNDAPVTIAFAVISIILFYVDILLCHGRMATALLSTPTNSSGPNPFVASDIFSYLNIFFYVFGAEDISLLLCNLIFLLLLGATLEDYYGSPLILICYIITTVFSGVLNALLCYGSVQGCSCLIMMTIFLSAFMSVSKNKAPVSSFFVLVIYIVREFMQKNANGIVGMFIVLIAGLCGALVAFILAPLVSANAKKNSRGLLNKAEKVREEKKPLFKKEKESTTIIRKKDDDYDDGPSDDDTTVVGTLQF